MKEFFQRAWEIQSQKWNLLVDYWYIHLAILIVCAIILYPLYKKYK